MARSSIHARIFALVAVCTWSVASFAAPPVAHGPVRSEVMPIRPTAPPPSGDYFVTRFKEVSAELAKYLGTPRAAASLYRLHSLAPDLPSLDPLAEVLKQTAQDRRASGEIQALARFLLADVERQRGALADSTADLAALSLAAQGWLVGGFDNEGGAGHDTRFPPETGAIDLKAAYPGKARQISWRLVPPLGPSAIVPVYDLLRPLKNVTFFYLTRLETPVAGRAVLHFGASGATKLWVNGHLVAREGDDHPTRFDQHASLVTLKKGGNTVLLKVSSLEEAPSFLLRVSKEGERPLVGARFTAPAAGDAQLACEEPGVPHELPFVGDTVTQLSNLAEAHGTDGLLLQDYATVLDARRPYDTKKQLARHQQEEAARLQPGNARAQALLARYVEDDHNIRRAALDRALAGEPLFAPARTQLAAYYSERGFARRGYDEATRAAADRPDYHPAQLAVAEALEAIGLEARGQKLVLDLAERYPTTPSVQLAAARTERSLGRLTAAADRYRRILQLRYDDRDARAELSSLLVDAGDVGGALALMRRATELAPTSVGAALRMADFLSFNGRPDEAVAVYDRLAIMDPDDDGIFEARGQHLLRRGDSVGAIREFQSALALKPQNPRLRELVASIKPQEDYAAPYLRDAAALAKSAPTKSPNGDDSAVVLTNLNVVRVYPNGLSSRIHQLVVKVFNDRGVDAARVQGVRYSPGEQEVKVERARIIKSNGTVVEAKSESDQGGEGYGGMYFDSRQRVVSFPNLEAGDVVEFTYRRDDVAQTNMFADYFGDVIFLQGTDPHADEDYVLIAPEGRTFYSNDPGLPGLKHTVDKTKDGLQIQRWRVANVPRIEPEPKMPGWANISAYLHVSTFKNWDDVGRFWWGLIHEQLQDSDSVKKAVAESGAEALPETDVKGRVRAVYGYVVSKTRYVGLEFGIHGFKPYKVDQILSRRFGDCKDKASLMYAMLTHLGIKSNVALLRMRGLGQLAPQPASLAVFNHAILYVPELKQFLDGTAEFSGSGELPDADQGAQVLVVQNDGKTPSQFFTTPVSVPEENVTDSTYSLALAPDGSATILGVSKVRGQAASLMRRTYESESGRREHSEQYFSQRYPGVKAVSFDIHDPRAIEEMVETRFSLTVPQLARKEGGALVFSPFGEPWRYTQGDAPQSKRSYPVDLGAPWQNEFHYTVKLPDGYALADPLGVVEKTSPFGHFRYETKWTPDGLLISGAVSIAVQRIEPGQYPAFRSYLEELDRTFSRRLRIAPTAALHTTEAAR